MPHQRITASFRLLLRTATERGHSKHRLPPDFKCLYSRYTHFPRHAPHTHVTPMKTGTWQPASNTHSQEYLHHDKSNGPDASDIHRPVQLT